MMLCRNSCQRNDRDARMVLSKGRTWIEKTSTITHHTYTPLRTIPTIPAVPVIVDMPQVSDEINKTCKSMRRLSRRWQRMGDSNASIRGPAKLEGREPVDCSKSTLLGGCTARLHLSTYVHLQVKLCGYTPQNYTLFVRISKGGIQTYVGAYKFNKRNYVDPQPYNPGLNTPIEAMPPQPRTSSYCV